MNKIIVAIVVIVVVVAVIVGILPLVSKKANDKTATPKASVPRPTSTTGDRHSAVDEIVVTSDDVNFNPTTIVAVAKKPLTITFKNNGKLPHNLTIKEFNAATKTLQPGQSETIRVTPDKVGMYFFECTVDAHAEKEIKGLLMIQPSS